jgi:hypothetical protein
VLKDFYLRWIKAFQGEFGAFANNADAEQIPSSSRMKSPAAQGSDEGWSPTRS